MHIAKDFTFCEAYNEWEYQVKRGMEWRVCRVKHPQPNAISFQLLFLKKNILNPRSMLKYNAKSHVFIQFVPILFKSYLCRPSVSENI